jgi:hypothetical protein
MKARWQEADQRCNKSFLAPRGPLVSLARPKLSRSKLAHHRALDTLAPLGRAATDLPAHSSARGDPKDPRGEEGSYGAQSYAAPGRLTL